MDYSQLLPPSPTQGPPLPKALDPYLPWKGLWSWIKTKVTGTGFGLKIYDSNGNLVATLGDNGEGHMASLALPGSLVEGGGPYTVVASIHNTSVYSGSSTPSPYVFRLELSITTALGKVLLYVAKKTLPQIGANLTATDTETFSIPIGDAGGSVSLAANLWPTVDIQGGMALASLNTNLPVTALQPVPNATLSFAALPSMQEGGGGAVVVTIVNKSVYGTGSTQAPYTFALLVVMSEGSPAVNPINYLQALPQFAAGEQRSVTLPYTLPFGSNGGGVLVAQLLTAPSGGQVINPPGSVTQNFTVAAAAVIPGGTISW